MNLPLLKNEDKVEITQPLSPKKVQHCAATAAARSRDFLWLQMQPQPSPFSLISSNITAKSWHWISTH